jgi:hypothetical protein
VYRGAAFTEADFQSKYAVGNKETGKNLTSTSTSLKTAAEWARGTRAGDAEGRTVSVVFINEDSGGKLLGAMSSQQGESEVLVPAGIETVVLDIIELSDDNTYASEIATAMDSVKADKTRPTPRKWYVVKLGRTKDHAPWQGKAGPTADAIMGASARFNRPGLGSARRR